MKKDTSKKKGLFGRLRTLYAFIGEYKQDMYLTWLFVFIESVCEILVTFFMQYLLRDVRELDMPGVYQNSLIIAGMVVVAGVTGIFAGFFASSAAVGFGKNLRDAMFVRVQSYSFENIDKFSIASIVTRTTTDVTNVQFAFMMIIRAVIRAPFMAIFATIMAFVIKWQLAWIFLLIIPVTLTILILIAKFVHPIFVRVFEEYDVLNEAVQEDVDGIRVVKSFNQEEHEKKKFGKISDFIYRHFIIAEKRLAWNGPTLNFAVYASILVIVYLGTYMIVNSQGSELNPEQLSSLVTYVMQIMMALMMVSMVYVMMTIARNSSERISELIEEKPTIENPENPITEIKDGSVSFRNVRFGYGEGVDVLSDIDFSVPSGSTVGIIGSTASSKTTLISLIARLYDVRDGSVLVGGEDVRSYDLVALRDAVSVVLQKNVLFTGTIRDNLRWGKADATDEEIWHALELAQAKGFVSSFPEQLNTKIAEGGTNVSGGQKQRLCIARALLKNPKILILDDSTSAVDTHTDALIRETLRKERPEVTKFIIGQRVLSIKDCDLILVMDRGRIVAQGTNDTLLQDCDIYRELYESQLGGGDFDAAE